METQADKTSSGAAKSRAEKTRPARAPRKDGGHSNESARSDDDLDGAWDRFLEPQSNSEFLSGWLRLTCARIPSSRSAILFIRADANRLGVGAVWNAGEDEREPFEALAGDVLNNAAPQLATRPDGVGLGYPIQIDGSVQAVLTIALPKHPGSALRQLFRELHWSAGWIEAQLWQGRSRVSAQQTSAARHTLELLASADSHERFDAAALSLVNAIPQISGFDRAALGMVRGRKVRVEALSRVAAFKPRTDWVSQIGMAMEESIAQNRPIALPKPEGAATPVDLAHRVLVDAIGGGAVLSVPLLVRGRAVGALTLIRQRADDEIVSIDSDTIEELRLAAASVAPVLHLKHEERRWISGRARKLGGSALTAVLGRRPAISLAAATVLLLAILPFLLTGQFRVNADAVLQGAEQRAAVALLDGFVAESGIRAGDRVERGDLLARLDDRDLLLEQSRLEANVAKTEQAMRDALAAGDRTASARANSDLAEAEASLDLVQQQLDRINVRAPTTGMVVSGDLSQRLGASVSRGDTLFEIARTDAYRLLIDVSEYDLAHVEEGRGGEVVFTGLSDLTVPFTVTGIASVSDAAEGENRFRVEADITGSNANLRPGLEGVAKIDAGRASFAWIWTRGTVNRLRVMLWKFMP